MNMRNVSQQDGTYTIKFAGDSGDGIQLTGSRFASTAADGGLSVMTLSDYPAEIRAPAGTLYGVSGYQLKMSSSETLEPGEKFDILVAFNAAALKVNQDQICLGGIIIVNEDGFTTKNLRQAHYQTNPLSDGSLDGFRVFRLPLAKMTHLALTKFSLSFKDKGRCKNFFALGITLHLLDRPLRETLDWLQDKFGHQKELCEANKQALVSGFESAAVMELPCFSFESKGKIDRHPGTYRHINGNQALVFGLLSATVKSGRRMVFGSYPITPASDILHEIVKLKDDFPVISLQAEDEMAACGVALGASFCGSIGVTATSGPGMVLKGEFINLAVMTELPLVIIDVQRAGPSTGMPTKTEQSDLLFALWGRNGESPVVVLAPASPSDCFSVAYEAIRIAIKFMTPVIVLSDSLLANGSETWALAEPDHLPVIDSSFDLEDEKKQFQPYLRHERTLARRWKVPGEAGFEHTIGGLEKENGSGRVSQDPNNHQLMVSLRREKIARVSDDIEEAEVFGAQDGNLLVVGWGSTFGAIRQAVTDLLASGHGLAHLHLRFINPLPRNMEKIFRFYQKIMVIENNQGQLLTRLRSELTFDGEGLFKIQGVAFHVSEIRLAILKKLGEFKNGSSQSKDTGS